MTRIDIVSGFLGAGKTTLIKKLLEEALAGTKVVLIENEYGEVGIDGGFLKEFGIEIREMNSGCICCSLVGDFSTSLKEVFDRYEPERILIEPSGVGKLSDVMQAAIDAADGTEMQMGSAVTVVDASKAKMYYTNFGEFFIDQIQTAATVVLTRVDKCDEEKVKEVAALIRSLNEKAVIVTTPLSDLDGKKLLDTIEGKDDLQADLLREMQEAAMHDDDDDDDEHEHHHHHDDDDDDDDEHEHHHHHHDDDDDDEHEHHNHHHHDHVEAIVDEKGNRIYSSTEHERQHHHHHHHHHGHDADEIFQSLGIETAGRYTRDQLEAILGSLKEEETYGIVLRAKGMLPTPDGEWLHFDYVPEEEEVRTGAADVTGKICIIGAELNEEALKALFLK